MTTMMSRRAGMTLIEVLIASAILIVLVVVVFTLLINSSDHYQGQAVLLSLDERGREILNEISKDLRMSKMDLIVNPATGLPIQPNTPPSDPPLPPPPLPPLLPPGVVYNDIQFRIPTTPPGTQTTPALADYQQPNSNRFFRQRIRYRWVSDPTDPVNNQDDNRNGLVDEGMIEKIVEDLDTGPVIPTVTATRTSRICRDVRNLGLVFRVPAQGQVEVFVDLQKRDPKFPTRILTRRVRTTIELRN